jgi:hypothetical protein
VGKTGINTTYKEITKEIELWIRRHILKDCGRWEHSWVPLCHCTGTGLGEPPKCGTVAQDEAQMNYRGASARLTQLHMQPGDGKSLRSKVWPLSMCSDQPSAVCLPSFRFMFHSREIYIRTWPISIQKCYARILGT